MSTDSRAARARVASPGPSDLTDARPAHPRLTAAGRSDGRGRGRGPGAATAPEIPQDAVYPRDEEHRYRVYARRGEDLEVLACAGTKEALGVALVTLDEDEQERGRRLIDLGAIGVLDVVSSRWIVLPWHRPEGRTRLRETEVTL